MCVSVCVCVLICGDLPACSPLGLFAQEIGRSRKLSIYIYVYVCACVLIEIYWDTMVMCHGEDGLQSLVNDLQVRTGTTSAAAYLRALGCVGLGAQGLQTSSIPGIFAVSVRTNSTMSETGSSFYSKFMANWESSGTQQFSRSNRLRNWP